MVSRIEWCDQVLLEVWCPDAEKWIEDLMTQFTSNESKVAKSHKIGGRWENLYLEVEDVPSVRIPMRIARDLGKEKLGVSSIVLFDSPSGNPNPYPPFWFNVAAPGESTGLHDHAQSSVLSAVAYLRSNENSGNLYFRKDGREDLQIKPEPGKMIVFPPSLRHGVHPNLSNEKRISFAFNLFPFPLVQAEL